MSAVTQWWRALTRCEKGRHDWQAWAVELDGTTVDRCPNCGGEKVVREGRITCLVLPVGPTIFEHPVEMRGQSITAAEDERRGRCREPGLNLRPETWH